MNYQSSFLDVSGTAFDEYLFLLTLIQVYWFQICLLFDIKEGYTDIGCWIASAFHDWYSLLWHKVYGIWLNLCHCVTIKDE